MSPFQTAQMFSLQRPEQYFNLAVRGVFDDCRDIVKAGVQRPRLQGQVQKSAR